MGTEIKFDLVDTFHDGTLHSLYLCPRYGAVFHYVACFSEFCLCSESKLFPVIISHLIGFIFRFSIGEVKFLLCSIFN